MLNINLKNYGEDVQEMIKGFNKTLYEQTNNIDLEIRDFCKQFVELTDTMIQSAKKCPNMLDKSSMMLALVTSAGLIQEATDDYMQKEMSDDTSKFLSELLRDLKKLVD